MPKLVTNLDDNEMFLNCFVRDVCMRQFVGMEVGV